jgi:transposase-like protein/IS1 family transposase
MKQVCPNKFCKFFQKSSNQRKDGFYFRRDDSRKIQRFKCACCLKKYSASSGTLEYKQKKRRMNRIIRNELSSGVSLRRCARNLSLHRTTIARKLDYLAKKARLSHSDFLISIQKESINQVQFDDLITSIHTKLKPLSISVVIDAKSRLILGAKVSEIPSFGKLAKISRNKYGSRKNEHPKNLDNLLQELKPIISSKAIFRTDEHKRYPEIIARHFQNASHEKYKSRKASVAGLGELKSRAYDPLFMINHTLAMLRANINRLFRRTWCTTKSIEQLQNHVDIFIEYFNEMVTEKNLK